MTVDVLDIHDRIIDHESQREDERKQRHAVDGVARPIIDHQSECEGDRHGGGHHQTFPPTEAVGEQRDHDDERHQQAFQQLVDLVVGGLAIVAGDAPVHARRQQRRSKRPHPLFDAFGDRDGIRALLLGDGDMNGRKQLPVTHVETAGLRGSEADPAHGPALGGPIPDFGNLGEIDGPAVDDIDHGLAQCLRIGQECPGIDEDMLVRAIESLRLRAGIGDAQCPGDIAGGRMMRRQCVGIEQHPDLARPAADDLGAVGLGQCLELGLQFFSNAPQTIVVDLLRTIGPQGDDDDRHIVDLDGLDHPGGDILGNAVGIGVELVVELDEAFLAIFTNEKAHGHHRAPRQRHRIDVLDSVDLREQLLDGRCDLAFHLLHRQTRRPDQHVGQGDDDLGLLLPRRGEQGEGAEAQGEEDQHRRELALQKEVDDGRK